ncbi:MAG: hypothetical protein JO090_08080, partial [Rhizobacter sp.]|nr:hypothetical protein [Rhizobacter sp.]
FVAMCVVLRRHFGADPRLDWFALIPFFGLSYKWGFLTFLVAAPIALALVLLSSRYAERPSVARGTAVFGVGLLLLASHGLQFVLGWSVATALLAYRWRRARFSLVAFLPPLLLAVACALYFLASRNVEADFNVPYEYYKKLDYDWKRLLKIPLFTVGQKEDVYLLPLVAMLLLVPWLYGLRPSRERAIACVPFAVVAAIMLLVPSFAMNTAFLYERFELYFLPTYAWMFAASPRRDVPGPSRRTLQRTSFAMIAVCCALLGLNAVRAWGFGRESSGLDALIRRLEPYQRALILVFDGDSPAAHNPFIYIQYPAWYQAEREGMVDFNFAWFPPQIVRFRPGHLPPWRPGYEWRPDRFDWKTHRGSDYRYFFVRSHSALPATLFKGAECPPMPIWSGDDWTVFERQACP